MAHNLISIAGRWLRRLWWLLDTGRRALLNGLLLLALLALAWWALRPGLPTLQDKTALVLDLKGRITEQQVGVDRASALRQLQGEGSAQLRLRDVLAVLDAAAADPHISHAVLLLDDFAGAGLPTLREVAAALQRFKATGKPVWAWSANFDQRQYYLAAQATQVWLHPMGSVYIAGLSRWRTYYKDLFDKLGLSANVIRVGSYKSFAENYSANGPSKESTAADSLLQNALWAAYTTAVEAARKLPPGSINQGIDALPGSLQAVAGNPAQLALNAKLVDALKTRDELRSLLIDKGAQNQSGDSFLQVSFFDYLRRIKAPRSGDAVGVIVAEGPITEGVAPPGSIGGLSTANLVRQAREDKHIKAVVLRVNSPGGSAFGSELVRRELELTRAAGKPVVVSMGDVAASGGYWISLAADEVIADETTITGSIGVISMLPTASGALDKLGLHTGGGSTTWLAGAYDVRRPIEPRFVALMQSALNHVYADFTRLAAQARKTTAQKIDAVAQGRVWTGAQAVSHGLIDRTGSFADALDAAASRAKLGPERRITYIERPPGRLQQALALLGVSPPNALAVLTTVGANEAAAWLAWRSAFAIPLQAELEWLRDMFDTSRPFAAQAHCLCAAP